MHSDHKKAPAGLAALSLAALGVVYGDIGTSPIYALRESLHLISPNGAAAATDVLGILSLIFWSLIIVVSVKYLVFVLRADNRGEGGILALAALVASGSGEDGKRKRLLVMMGLFGAALLYGDSVITPAISVLSAVEGIAVVTPLLVRFVIPATVIIIAALFAVQKRGTASVGAVFGPVTLVWFIVTGCLGARQILLKPDVLVALLPNYALGYFAAHGFSGLLVLGTVFLAVTGGEALYADMGHFGVRPIRIAWFYLVLPCLILNYFGQGALLLRDGSAIEHPFFRMVPAWGLLPMVALTTAATIIASQAVISGAYSLTRQAIQLGYLPRLAILHTSEHTVGQIYVPAVNWSLMLATLALVIGFKTSSNLAAAYGVAVTTQMVVTTILLATVARKCWHWKVTPIVALTAILLAMDVSFWLATLPKIPAGGWFPLVVAGILFAVMTTWKRGRALLAARLRGGLLPVEDFISEVRRNGMHRVEGTAIFLDSQSEGTPSALAHNVKHNHVLHDRVVLLTVVTEEVPRVPEEERVRHAELGEGFYRIIMRFGFAESPNVPKVLWGMDVGGRPFRLMDTTFVLGREQVKATRRPGMALWRERLFGVLSKNAASAPDYFHLPANRVVEIGTQVEI